ncbi:MAG TPA: tetratricopeptide repeat protein [Solirubrobacterales bacterium]|nr:tetratricopeptide repeat protein [Solirubrobacterales bacterium]
MKTQRNHGPRVRQWHDELNSSLPDVAALAALRLGRYLLAIDEGEGAKLLSRALRAENPQVGARAAWALAEAYRAAGECRLSQIYQLRAERISEEHLTPDVVLSLASRYAAVGEVDRAINAYQRLLDEGTVADREIVALAAFRLSDLLIERRSYVRAVKLLRKAIRDGAPTLRAHAMSDLADLLIACTTDESEVKVPTGLPEDCEELREAAATLYQRIIETDHPDLAPRAAYHLAGIRQDAGDWVAAEEVLQMVLESEHPVYAPMAERRLLDNEQRASFDAAVDKFLAEVLTAPQLSLDESAFNRDTEKVLVPTLREAEWCEPVSAERCDFTDSHVPVSHVLIVHLVGPPKARAAGWISDGLDVWERVELRRDHIMQAHMVGYRFDGLNNLSGCGWIASSGLIADAILRQTSPSDPIAEALGTERQVSGGSCLVSVDSKSSVQH